MILKLAATALAGLIVVAAQSQGGQDEASPASRPTPALAWDDWAEDLKAAAPPAAAAAETAPAPEVDVVDAHWMALTMWGEARGQGEEAMRAVGHVIDNRWKSGRHGGYATDTVSEAWQFSCWNAGDPNLTAIRQVDSLSPAAHDHAMWQAARRIAGEILAGRSEDPTGGALFYHATYVAPRWSRGVPPVARIGNHLFFRSAR